MIKPFSSETPDSTGDELVSVIVPTLNSGGTLEGCLRSIDQQTWKNVETIVVDGGSQDATLEISIRYADVVLQVEGERSLARNIGAGLGRGSLLAFIDSDMYLESEVLEQCVEVVRANPRCAIILPEIAIGQGFWASCRTLDKRCSLGNSRREAARCFTSNAWVELGGFDASLGPAGEDWDLTLRTKKRHIPILRIRSVVSHDEGRILLRRCAQKKYYYGKYIVRYVAKHPEEARSQLTLIRSSYVNNWRLLVRRPLTTIGMFVLKGVELFGGWLGYRDGIRRYNPQDD